MNIGNKCIPALLGAIPAVVFVLAFWWPLCTGGGFVGGDIYSYYFPQKVFYASQLQQGTIPLWNDLVGNGYPVLGESQTGVFYPFHLLFYSLFDVAAAYNFSFLFHYILAFFAVTIYCRTLGFTFHSTLIAATVYAFGWFPTRNCLEWSIIDGCWLPFALWAVERFLQSGYWRYGIGLSFILAMQLLSGHYNIAFITQMMLLVYIPARAWWMMRNASQESDSDLRISSVKKISLFLGVVLFCSYGLSAVQLLPSWELKNLSQREGENTEHDPERGLLPVEYLSQIYRPWHWYSLNTNRDKELQEMTADHKTSTNQVEAHLFFGLAPLGLALLGIGIGFWRRDFISLLWFLLGFVFLIYATGIPLPLFRNLPGFGYFQGPGRFGIVTTLAVGMLSAYSLDWICRHTSMQWLIAMVVLFGISVVSTMFLIENTDSLVKDNDLHNPLVTGAFSIEQANTMIPIIVGCAAFLGVLFFLYRKCDPHQCGSIGGIVASSFMISTTLLELWTVSRLVNVNYTTVTENPPIRHLAESELKKILDDYDEPVRLFAPFANTPTTLGVASTPVYLTFGPNEYADPKLKMPDDKQGKKEQIVWLLKNGVTHIVSFKELDRKIWPVGEPVWFGVDAFYNRTLGRAEPIFLYEFEKTKNRRGRVSWNNPNHRGTIRIENYSPHEVRIVVDSVQAGKLVLTDLWYPGWQVEIDGKPAESLKHEGMFRAVEVTEGYHEIRWVYRPWSVYFGATVSLLTLIFLATIAHIRFWHPKKLRRLDPFVSPG